MATYEYECKCGSTTSTYGEPAHKTVKCLACGKRAKRIVSACNFILKGAGFYCVDYPKGGKKDE